MPPRPQSLTKPPLPPAVFLILLVLSEEAAHGYRLRQAVLERSGSTVRLDPGSLYRLIARLVDDELIAEAGAPPGVHSDDERRRYYKLTPAGRRVLRAETERMATLVTTARASARRTGHA